ncbi:MAG: hypothetical protein RJA45_555 [Actinomycetota bacterium]
MNFALFASIGFYAVCLFQFALILGAPWGEYTMGGQKKGKLSSQGRVMAGVSILVLILMAQVLLATIGDGLITDWPSPILEVLKWLTFAYAILGFVMNWITRSKKERMVWGPVATILLVLVSLAIFGTGVPIVD